MSWNAPSPAALALGKEERRLAKKRLQDFQDLKDAVRNEREAEQRAYRELDVTLAIQAAEMEAGYACPPGQAEFLAVLLRELLPK